MFLRRAMITAAAVLMAAGCSADPDTPTDALPTDSTGTFPQTVTTDFGDVTVDAAPDRIIALGWGDAETALALGVQPIGASDWLGFGGDGVGPWADGLYTESPEIIGTLEPSYEQIAALEPDLILDTKSSGDRARYDRLSAIAPTVGVPVGGQNYLTTTEQQVTSISTALGIPERGRELLERNTAAFADAAAAHPHWQGRTATVAARSSRGWAAYISGGGRVETMAEFGFVQNPTIESLPVSGTGFSVAVSDERLDQLDADVVVAAPIYLDQNVITDDPLWQRVPAVTQNRAIVLDRDLAQAFATATTLATAYTIDHLVPLLERAAPA